MLKSLLSIAVGSTVVVTAAAASNLSISGAELAAMKAEYQRPTEIPQPADNPGTPEKIALGRTLFFDPSLSASGMVSCATCHDPRYGFEDRHARSTGVAGKPLGRHSPTAVNMAWASTFFWDGRADTLEEQALGPITSDAEMGMVPEDLVATLMEQPAYREAFTAAFPGETISVEHLGKAIAAFERTLVSANSPFDAWIAGDEAAISDAAKRGFVLFNTDGNCASCHSGWNFTDDSFHDIGLRSEDIGRFKVLELDSMKRAFKTPGLRDIVERAPYMHSGDIATLEEVVAHYDHGFVHRDSLSELIQPLGLTAQQQSDLVAFLKTLSSPVDEDLLRAAEISEARALQAGQARLNGKEETSHASVESD